MDFGNKQHRSFRSDRCLPKTSNVGRHYLAWAILAGCMSTLGALAIERCIDVEIAQALDRQEDFSAYRTAASYAGETVR